MLQGAKKSKKKKTKKEGAGGSGEVIIDSNGGTADSADVNRANYLYHLNNRNNPILRFEPKQFFDSNFSNQRISTIMASKGA